MKEVFKNCSHARPTYKGIICEGTNKKTKTQDTCEHWAPKGGRR